MADHNRTPVTLTMQEAERLVVYHQGLTGSGDPDRIIQAFTPDAVVRFADFPEMRGQAALRQFLVSRFARQKNYRLKKQLRAVSGNVIVCSWDGAWEDGRDGRAMEGRGIEMMTMEDGKIASWEAVMNVWARGTSGSLPII